MKAKQRVTALGTKRGFVQVPVATALCFPKPLCFVVPLFPRHKTACELKREQQRLPRGEMNVRPPTLHLCLCRVLTGSTGRATNIPSSLRRWSWDPPASEIWKEDESEHKAPGVVRGLRAGWWGVGYSVGVWGDPLASLGGGCEDLGVVPKHRWPLAQQRLLRQPQQQALSVPASEAQQLQLPIANVLHTKDNDLKGCTLFYSFLFSQKASEIEFFHKSWLSLGWPRVGEGEQFLYIGSLF